MANRQANPYGGPVDRHGNPLQAFPDAPPFRDPSIGRDRHMTRTEYEKVWNGGQPISDEEWHQYTEGWRKSLTHGDTPMSRLEGSGGTNYLAGGAGADRVSATGAWLPGKTLSSADLLARLKAEAAAAQPGGLTGMEHSPEMAGQIPPSYGGPPRFFGGPGDGELSPPDANSPLAQYQREQLAAAVQQRASASAGVGSGRPSYPAPNSPSGTSGIRGLANAVVGAPGALGNAIFGPGGPIMNASQAVNGWLGDLTAPATAVLPPPTGNAGAPAATRAAPMSPTPIMESNAGDYSYGGDYPQNYITSGGGQSANAPWKTPTAAPAYTGGVPSFSPPATPPAASAEAIPAYGIANAGPGLGSSQLTFTPHNPFAGAQAGASITPAGDPAPPPAVDSTGLSVDDTGNPYFAGGRGPMARAPIGTQYVGAPKPKVTFADRAVPAVAGMTPGIGLILAPILRSAMRTGSFDNAQSYRGPIQGRNYATLMTSGGVPALTDYGTRQYSGPNGISNSPFTPQGYTAPNFNLVSGGPSYAYQPNGQGGGTYVDSAGRVHQY